ncbi:MAG: tyrosine-type recombinase/integrase [Actinomycetota bacterium]|nr:tyrosine-type recombinase/integrase [Actinomycetota bacterium]
MRGRRTPVPAAAAEIYAAYLDWLLARGVGNRNFDSYARSFFARFARPQDFGSLPLAERQAISIPAVQPLLNFLMLYGHLRPGYDYLIDRKLSTISRDAASSPLGDDLARFLAGAKALGYAPQSRTGMASEVLLRLLIETGLRLAELGEHELSELQAALLEREEHLGRILKHYRTALFASRTVLYHLGNDVELEARRPSFERWGWSRHLEGVGPQVVAPMVAYLERLEATLSRSTVVTRAGELAHFGRFLARCDPCLASLAQLDRRRHIEPYLTEVARSVNHRTGQPIAASTAKQRIQTIGCFFDQMGEWGWEEAPPRRLVFARDAPCIPHPLPRYLPPDEDRTLVAALEASPNRLLADALLLLRQSGLRIGELCDLELDCVHEVPGQGAWLKVPLGKLATERMVPLDEETVTLVDRLVANRSPGQPIRHPRSGALVDFLLTHHGRRVSACTLRVELHRAAAEAGIEGAVPHQLRHTYATALVNSGCSLQALMALLGHVSAEMSLRYGRLFDRTVRESYERALAQAKASLGPVLPEATPVHLETNWRKAPLIKARLAGGYCLRTVAQSSCAYANICEHCPNFRSEKALLPVLQLQRVDAEALLADAKERGWGEEAARHRRLIERIDALIASSRAG